MSNKQTVPASLINYYSLITDKEPLKVTIIGNEHSILVCLNELLKWKSNIRLSGLYTEANHRSDQFHMDPGDFIFIDTSLDIKAEEFVHYQEEKFVFFDPDNIDDLQKDLIRLKPEETETSNNESKNKPVSTTFINPSLSQIAINEAFSVKYGLSRRESMTLHYLVNGHSYKMIAAEMFISIDTVRSHIKRIYQKLGVNSNAQAICMVITEGN